MAMIVLLWSRATRDLLKSFGWGIAALHRLMRDEVAILAARPIESSGPRSKEDQPFRACPSLYDLRGCFRSSAFPWLGLSGPSRWPSVRNADPEPSRYPCRVVLCANAGRMVSNADRSL